MIAPLFWSCPACRKPLDKINSNSLACEHGHNYDKARQGYLNLLLANQKRRAEPGDSAEMIQARQRFLSAGYYDFLLENMALALAKEVSAANAIVLDLGCGEGHYTRSLSGQFPAWSVWGIDISRAAVKLAATTNKSGSYAVASAVDIPLPDHSVDVIINVFAPLYPDEIKRVLKPDGLLLRVSPAAEHLQQIKALIYKEPRAHELPEIPMGTRVVFSEVVHRCSRLDNSALNNLLTMTPMQWRSDNTMKENFKTLSALDVDFHFLIQGLRYD